MSLDRYTNNEQLKSLSKPTTGEVFSDKELQSLPNSLFLPKFTKIGSDLNSLISEAHFYSIEGDYIKSVLGNTPLIETQPDSPYTIFFDVRNIFRTSGISRGTYRIVFNLIESVFGNPNTADKHPLFVKEISPDRTEIQLSITNNESDSGILQSLSRYCRNLSNSNGLNNIILNFGENRINKIINFRTDLDDPTVIYFKLHLPIDADIDVLDTVWVGYELIDSYIDTFTITSEVSANPINLLKGPKFEIDIDDYQSQSTIYKSWEDLLTSDLPTTQRILDNAFSASSQAILNIDYSEWENFIFYSTAEERLSNFNYKMGLIEAYSIDNSTLNSVSGSGSIYVVNNVSANQNKINTILDSFDSFERWLYYSPTGSIFTHDITGSLTPWPKFEANNTQLNYSPTSSIVSEWYNTNLNSAILYDETNYNSLWWSLPEHILMDENNSQYQLFVQMIGHHFDNIYMYVKALTQIHERDEHPQRGPSNDLLPYIAKSFGWNLQNVRQLSDLWLYKLGSDETGSFTNSPDFRVGPHIEQTEQVWRRIVNNLPFLLKTKGTARSVKAMMSIYGIPQSFISIKEYGGPGLDNDLPILIEDTYAYKLNVSSESYLRIPQDNITATLDGWGNLSVCDVDDLNLPSNTLPRKPDTYEFRFSTEQSASLGILPLYVATSGSGASIYPTIIVSLVSYKELSGGVSSSYSGSDAYGKVLLEIHGSESYAPNYVYSDYLPIFDGDLWTVRLYESSPGTLGDEKILTIARASDSLYGRISHKAIVSASYDVIGKFDSVYLGGGPSDLYSKLDQFTNTTHSYSISNAFEGSVQSYKEYYTIYNDETFFNHTRNPRAYNVDSISGSFYSLYRFYPLGLDVQRYDHSITTSVSSSHPDRSKQPTPIEFVNFTGSQFDQYSSINETFYSVSPQIAGQTIGNEKIRLEDSFLKFELSPDARGESAEYNDKPNDRNRLAIVFSTSDQINRDIANHMGAANFEEWIADPEFEFGSSYPVLNAKAQEYFQKYQKKYDINSFIRILSVYDYTFFEQIRQLVPGRADLIAGILIEPHMLQRSKVQISRLPQVTNPQWSDTIEYIPTQSAAYVTYNSGFSLTGSTDIIQFYETASIGLDNDVLINPNYLTSSIGYPYPLKEANYIYATSSIGYPDILKEANYIYASASIESPYFIKDAQFIKIISGSIVNGIQFADRDLNSGSGGNSVISIITSSFIMPWKFDKDISDTADTVISTSSFGYGNSTETVSVLRPILANVDVFDSGSGDVYVINKTEIQVVNKYDGFKSGSLNTYITQSAIDCRYKRKVYYYDAYMLNDSLFSSAWYGVGGSAVIQNFTGTISNIIKDKMNNVIQFANSLKLERQFIAESGSRYIIDLYVMPLNTSSLAELTVKVFETATPANINLNQMIRISYSKDINNEWVNRYKLDFIASGSTTIQLSANAQTLLFYEVSGLYNYLNPWQEGWIRAQNKDRQLPSTTVYESWYYQYNECSAVNRIRFEGSKLIGAGINIDSPNTIDGGPVVEIRQTNPNSIFKNAENSDGNLRVEKF